MYQPIDQNRTGLKLEIMMRFSGYDVKYIQKYLHLSCPQSVYRWFKGKALPSIEHLYAVSRLIGASMEDFLIMKGQPITCGFESVVSCPGVRRLSAYTSKYRECKG